MERIETLSIYRSWKEPFDERELDYLSQALTDAVRRTKNPIVTIRSISKADGEELQAQVTAA